MAGDRTDAMVIAESTADPRAFAVVFDRHFEAVHGYVSRRAGRAAADELTGEVFLTAFEARTRYDGLRPDARPWLLGIATHLVARRYRGVERQTRAYERLGAVESRSADEYAAADGRIDAAREVPDLHAVIAGLSDDDRDVLLLFAWESLGYDEIAHALGVPVGTVKSRLHRARRIVREHLDARRAIPGQTIAAGGEPRE